MVFNMSFIKMQEQKKSSLIFISQEYAVRTKKKIFFSLQTLQICSAALSKGILFPHHGALIILSAG